MASFREIRSILLQSFDDGDISGRGPSSLLT